MNGNIKRWAGRAVVAFMAAFMAACGGGGAGGGGGGGDDGQATVSVRVEGLQASMLTLVDDLGHTAVYNANGVQTFARMAVGTVFTPAIASQPSNQVCRLDAGARTVSGAMELLVRCDAGLLTTGGLPSYAVDQMVVMDTLEAGAVSSASLGGQTLTFTEAATGGFTFRVPSLAAGAHELRAVVNGRAFTTTLDITANPLSVAPDAFLRTAASAAQADIATRLADPATTEDERVALQQLQTALGGLDGALATASAEDIRNMARLLAANDPDVWLAAGGRASAAAVEPNAALCDRYSNRLGFSMAGTVAFMAMTNIAMTSGVGAPITALTTYAFIRMIKQTMDDAGGVVDHCVGVVAMPILKVIRTNPQSMGLASGSVAAYSLERMQAQAGTGMAFNHGEASVLEVQLQKALLAEVTDRLLKAASRLVDLHGSLSALVADVVTLPGGDLMARLRTLQRSFSQPAQALRLEGLPSGITGDVTPMLDMQGLPTGRYEVVFRSSVEPSSSQPMPFSFRLRETEADYLGPVVSATLQVPLTPVAADLAFETGLDTALNARLNATHATSFTLLDMPSSGSLVLTDAATGAFTYTPSTGFSGTVGFTYRASNERATSQTATVVIAVLANCGLRRFNSGSMRWTCFKVAPAGVELESGAYLDYLPTFWWDQFGVLPVILESESDYRADQSRYRDKDEYIDAPAALQSRVAVESAFYEATSDTFTANLSEATYLISTGALAMPTQAAPDGQRVRAKMTFVRHPITDKHVPATWSGASTDHTLYSDGRIVLTRLTRMDMGLEGFDANGVPTYRTQFTECTRGLDSNSGEVEPWDVVRASLLNNAVTTEVRLVSCPLSESGLLNAIGPEKGLNDLSFNWR